MMHLTSSSSEGNSGEEKNKKILPEPSCKEFILRTVTPQPSVTPQPQPQRLYVCLRQESFRLAGLFSEDTTFL